MPGALGLLTPSVAGAANCVASATSLAPFITLNLSGGAGLSGNYVPRDANMQPLSSYSKLGLGNNTGANALSFESEFGVPGFASFNGNIVSQLLVQLRANCDVATLANTAFVAVCVQSQDDTSANRFDAG